MSDALHPETTILDAMILALLLVDARSEIRNDPDVSPFGRERAMDGRMADLLEAARSLRLRAVGLATDSHPDTTLALAAAGAAAKAAAATKFSDSAVARNITNHREVMAATEALTAADDDLATAQQVLERELAGKGSGAARDVVLARGAVREATERKAAAEAALKALRAAQVAQ